MGKLSVALSTSIAVKEYLEIRFVKAHFSIFQSCDTNKKVDFLACDPIWTFHTLFESENERQKIEPAPILLPRASRNFTNVKTRKEKKYIIGLQR